MSDEKESASPAPPTRYSRYHRSQRQTTKAEPARAPEPEEHHEDLGRTKSMSRYRRSRAPTNPDQITSNPPMPPVPALPRAHTVSHRQNASSNGTNESPRRVTDPVQSAQQQAYDKLNGTQPSQGRPRETEHERMRRKAHERHEQERQERQARKMQEEQEQQERRRLKLLAEEEAKEARRIEEENAQLLAEQKRKDLERLQAELDNAAPNVLPVTSPKAKFGFFSRKRSATKMGPPPASMNNGSAAPSLSRTVSKDPQRGIEVGGGGIVPQVDAPVSAVNAGERRVLIRCKQSSINLPITPETTPVDIIYSAANVMSQSIIPASAILLESYTQLGLERRIRRHEHIRDVMNSWDRDTQNALILQNSDSPKFDTDLEASSVSKEAPPNITVHLYHSQKPGKWVKRYTTLLSSGQIYVHKKPGATQSDKDTFNICHLSDFDIYTATPQQLRKVLKPPRKHCYAIKSQQKTTMFLSTENFVHFFCTDDEEVAHTWYAAVQGWRSWYLVNKRGERVKGPTKKTTEISSRGPTRPGTQNGPTHRVKVSVDESPYTIGSFTPLLNMDRFDASSKSGSYDSDDENRPLQIPFHLRNSISAGALPKRERSRHPPPVAYRVPGESPSGRDEEFASSGLLGRTYSERQKHLQESDFEKRNGPFVEGPSLINAGPTHQRTMSMKSTRVKSEREPATNGGSLQNKPKPLLDFTPEFKEAPQWDKKGKGHGVAPVQGRRLVEVATTPDNPLAGIPKATTVFRREDDMRRRPVTAGAAVARGQTVRGRERGRTGYD